MITKVGRNKLCPCGSGRKYKKCHGSVAGRRSRAIVDSKKFEEAMRQNLQQHQAKEAQRIKQQGLGRSIVSTEFQGHRVVAVGNEVHWSKSWKTFFDFLCYYIKKSLGSDWGNAELKKPFENRHPIIQWYKYVCDLQHQHKQEDGGVYSAPMTGAAAAYLRLAYNLYLVAHNAKLQKTLINRLKIPDQFHGAYYETYVAASFIKAGFDLEFENESDGSSTHCEFTATCRSTGNKYSVEAKARNVAGVLGSASGAKTETESVRISHQLVKALRKNAAHTRIIFIDMNVPESVDPEVEMNCLDMALKTIRDKESAGLTVNGQPAPPAYVFVTNHPYHYYLDGQGFNCGLLAEGFKIPDFKDGTPYFSLRDALDAREKHRDMHQLMKSMKEHYDIPSTFDGENPEFAFAGKSLPRLIIGNKYLVPRSDGIEVAGKLVDAVVMEKEKKVYGVYQLENGHSIIATNPMTDYELQAYKRHPETFFGVHKPKQKIDNPLELYDFMFNTYQHTSKEKLLDFLKDSPNFEQLKNLSQRELAQRYCEGCVTSAVYQNLI